MEKMKFDWTKLDCQLQKAMKPFIVINSLCAELFWRITKIYLRFGPLLYTDMKLKSFFIEEPFSQSTRL